VSTIRSAPHTPQRRFQPAWDGGSARPEGCALQRGGEQERRTQGLARDGRNVICVIGDGAMSAGMAYEAMNNAGALKSRLIVILNDNDMSIAAAGGAMSAYLSRLMSSRSFLSLRELAVRMAKRFPRGIERTARRAEEYARGMLTGGTLFEELGFITSVRSTGITSITSSNSVRRSACRGRIPRRAGRCVRCHAGNAWPFARRVRAATGSCAKDISRDR